MKNLIEYYYNITIDKVKENEEFSVVQQKNQIYIFKKMVQSDEEIKKIIDVLLSYNAPTHKIVINKDGQISTKYNNENYILIYLESTNEEIKAPFNFWFYNEEKDYSALWENKIDYFVRQINELTITDEIILQSFNYYIGLAENALAYYKRSLKQSELVRYAVVHRRITYPNYSINYYDPSSMLIDTFTRDIAEYIKSKFYNDQLSVEEALNIIYNYDMNSKELNLLYARLLFPTYYFDIFDNNLNHSVDKEKLDNILAKRKEYEIFLRDIYLSLRDNYALFEVEWLANNSLEFTIDNTF